MKVEVATLGSPSLNSPNGLCGRKATLNRRVSKLRSCVKVEVATLGSPSLNSPNGLCGRKATLNRRVSKLRSCVKVEVATLGSPSLTVLTVSVDVKQHRTVVYQSSGAV